MSAPNAEDFRRELRSRLEDAHARGDDHLEITSGELHRAVGNYPGDHRMPTYCSVMKSEMTGGDEILDEPKEGEGASLLVRYKLPRQSVVVEPAQPPAPSSADAPAHSNAAPASSGWTPKAKRNLFGILLGWILFWK
ncbi:MAG: hypothetical protein MPK62_08680 [Alphaproteobacteria bacterium]|nr:hypothetical protein [Alphaproteobacteria bacterium]MDA8031184.1 hypothetical protein [Alphaproteobacteria bacterium]